MKTLIFAVFTALFLATLAGSIFFGATHQLFFSAITGTIARVLYTDKQYSASPRFVLIRMRSRFLPRKQQHSAPYFPKTKSCSYESN